MARQIRRSQFAHLEDQEISVTDAAKKYGLSRRSIERWVARGYVRGLGIAPGYKRRKMVNEADVAYARALVEIKDPAQGQALFES
jgi:transposase